MTWKNRKVQVTGADGFIGCHLAEALAARGAEVTALALPCNICPIGPPVLMEHNSRFHHTLGLNT